MKTRWSFAVGFLLSFGASCGFGAPALSTLRSFGSPARSAAYPRAGLIEGTDGVLYGTTPAGGAAGQGVVFRSNKDGSDFQAIKSFGTAQVDGVRPTAAVIQASDGALYGTTDEGGQFGYGTVFRLNTDGTGYQILMNFTGGTDGAYPEGRLLEASDGLLYGTTSGGGTNDSGGIFRIGKDGFGFLPVFDFAVTNGANPGSGLIEASDGMLYGTTEWGGTNSSSITNMGCVFRLNKDGSGFTNLAWLFAILGPQSWQTNGQIPICRLVEGTNGMLYGVASAGGTNGTGTLFALNKDGSGLRTLHFFGGYTGNDAQSPVTGFTLASDGFLYGASYDGGAYDSGAVYRIGQDGSNYAVIADFQLAQGPAGALLQAEDGAFYGTTELGGDSGAGTLFTIQSDGTQFAIIKSLSISGGDGQSPYSPLSVASDGAFYGTTRLGGSQGGGTIFSIGFDGRGYRQIWGLSSTGAAGNSPVAGVIEGTNGALYGNTEYGGPATNGTIFSILKDGSGFTTISSGSAATNGQEPRATLLFGSDGALYGSTVRGVAANPGALFRVNTDGSGYTILEQFTSFPPKPGANPTQPLIEASDQMLYGVASAGGASNNGTLFRIAKGGGSFTVLKVFGNALTDGADPSSPLLEASDGLLYGTTYAGGPTNNAGTIFQIHKDGSAFLMIHGFTGVAGDVRHPCGRLVEAPSGALYGTSERGGANDEGAVFTINKDGTGYSLLASFGGSVGSYPRGGLVLGFDGAFFGTTDQGGDMGLGTVFRYGAPDEFISNIEFLNGMADLNCVGLPGTNYWVERSGALGQGALWLPIYSTNVPAGGQFGFLDANPPASAAFYRIRR